VFGGETADEALNEASGKSKKSFVVVVVVVVVVMIDGIVVFAADDGQEGRDVSDYIVDLREYDVPYYMRVAIDLSMFDASVFCSFDLCF
jgi:DNA polymerase elongation subunit (family B)